MRALSSAPSSLSTALHLLLLYFLLPPFLTHSTLCCLTLLSFLLLFPADISFRGFFLPFIFPHLLPVSHPLTHIIIIWLPGFVQQTPKNPSGKAMSTSNSSSALGRVMLYVTPWFKALHWLPRACKTEFRLQGGRRCPSSCLSACLSFILSIVHWFSKQISLVMSAYHARADTVLELERKYGINTKIFTNEMMSGICFKIMQGVGERS